MEKIVRVPNLPENKVSLAVVDGRIPRDIEKALLYKKIKIIKTKKIGALYNSISYHPDIMMCHIGGSDIVVARNISEDFVYKLEDNGFNIIQGKSELTNKYPLDVQYNVCIDEDCVICNEKFTDTTLIDKLVQKGKRIINVKQGYTKCSTLIVSSGVFVTSDPGIHTILIKEKKESLLISPGFIDLFDMNYGFIGGASGKISSLELGFYGNISLHKDANEINEFLKKHRVKPMSLSKNKLIDLGTLIPLKEYNGI
ncbi:DUF6873 family GME fold protein [Clostridium cylindrosporum]|uniref:DUF6873 domain-containing protein n=1 Tax=Clostridium cylindrosporum DSM 605 TaxID=1121307 RepID=A0A0J8D9F6_CLOCY|nr:hypothetical protein [Clostridium cylindrosporum]KMT22670.1 hypothetical protein CLCY_9c01010 [Clostridium cylindrosporum DSM 605]